MYTQCPHCHTAFELSDEEMGAQQGRVRCGHCREIFDASWNLVDVEREGADAAVVQSSGVSGHRAPDGPQKWTVSEIDSAADTGPTSGDDRASTESLRLDDLADTEEVAPRDDGADISPAPQREEPPQFERSAAGPPPDSGVHGDVDEEIVIEAPTNLWRIGDEPAEIEGGAAEPSAEAAAVGPLRRPEPRMIPLARQADDVKLVQIPEPKPLQAIAWAIALLVLIAAVFWQLKQYYISELAGVAVLRAPLESICEYVSCTVPSRTDIKRIDLVGTGVDPHPAIPGALRVSANLVNRAAFAQPFPPLEVTLTDREGEVVGRRTYLPHEYRSGPPGNMEPNVLERADLDLAQPAQSAVGYEIQLVAR